MAAICSNLKPYISIPQLSHPTIFWGQGRPERLRGARGKQQMFEIRDLFQWDRFITPTIIKVFYWLVIVLIVLSGLSGIFAGLSSMAVSPFSGFITILLNVAGVLVGILFSRIAAESILIVFRINEHLGAIRDQGATRP
ncbi:hypothetical protein NWI01_04700 [Nitrobacter winogradskyi]|uniref:DUF4282 domain-containing protein n=2 Tax=Nitrobacter winogradskyi TaxID=913 RepID=A0A4Y3W7L3_NITWI|nr:hypothetical protein NWI01_04700 [Nitrobacter winogradskyi]